MEIKHHGISLKITDSSSKHVPTASLGIESSGPKAKATFEKHKKDILKAHPALKGMNKEARKQHLKDHPEVASDIKKRNSATLNTVAKDLHHHLTTGGHEKLVHHIRQVLHAHKTPMEEHGHTHTRHITYETSKGTQHHSVNPGTHHEHILADHKNITVEHKGGSISFKHKGKTFARHAMKFDSQSDPLSSLKSAGTPAGD